MKVILFVKKKLIRTVIFKVDVIINEQRITPDSSIYSLGGIESGFLKIFNGTGKVFSNIPRTGKIIKK